MAAIKKNKYAVIDIETTGGMARRDKITEIAIIVTDGENILDQYSSLVHPERSIPHEITRITGITDEMVASAPRFYEIAKTIIELTEDAIFVAHNVNFDYNFIRYEFERLGYTYSRKQLCTVKLSRKAFPGLSSYSLGNLIQHFGIEVSARHRALDDAKAACILLHRIIDTDLPESSRDLIRRGIRENKLPESISMDRLHTLPEITGVYYFYDRYGTIIYIGKSINIRSRVLQHFGQVTAKQEKLMRQVADLDFTVTGSELIALLLESEEIKVHHPEINKAQKKKEYPYVITTDSDSSGFRNFYIENADARKLKGQVLCYQTSTSTARSLLGYMRELYALCEEKIEPSPNRRCIYHQLGECNGACAGLEEAADYNERADQAKLHMTRVFEDDFVLFTDGRSADELGMVWIENQKYLGFGYVSSDQADGDPEFLREMIQVRLSTPEANAIIQLYLRNGKYISIKKLSSLQSQD